MSMISKASGYAPGWMEDYGTVASALHSNYSAVRGFSTGDLTVGMTYLWDAERKSRKASQAGSAHLPYPGDCGAVHKDESDEFRRLCIAVDASYLTDRNELVDTLKTIGHEIHDSVQKSTFQEPAFFISESQARNEVFFVIRGTASMKDALTDGDCAAEDLNSTLPEFAGVKAHRGMTKSAHALLDKHASKICKCVEMFELKKKKPRFIVLGHSLGAGTAAIASILLKEKLGKHGSDKPASPGFFQGLGLTLSPTARTPGEPKTPTKTPLKTYNTLAKDTKALNVDLKESASKVRDMVAKGTWRNYQPIAMWPTAQERSAVSVLVRRWKQGRKNRDAKSIHDALEDNQTLEGAQGVLTPTWFGSLKKGGTGIRKTTSFGLANAADDEEKEEEE